MNRRGLLNWFLSPTFDRYNMSQHDIKNVARMICSQLSETNELGNHNDFEIINVSEPSARLYMDSDYLEPVVQIHDALKAAAPKYIKHFLVHGSLADFNYIRGWSDLDTWVVVDDTVFDRPLELVSLRWFFKELNRLLLKIDPIAHHGFIFVLESDLENYSDSLLPVNVVRSAINLYGSSEIYIREAHTRSDWKAKFKDMRDTFVEFDSSGVFMHHAYNGEYLTRGMIDKNEGMYQFKYMVGAAMILPSMYYTALGRPVYKADSFKPFLQKFPESAPIISCVSSIRRDWEKMERHPYVSNRIPNWLLERLPADYVSQIIYLIDGILENIKGVEHVS